jgi:hypothetical protein
MFLLWPCHYFEIIPSSTLTQYNLFTWKIENSNSYYHNDHILTMWSLFSSKICCLLFSLSSFKVWAEKGCTGPEITGGLGWHRGEGQPSCPRPSLKYWLFKFDSLSPINVDISANTRSILPRSSLPLGSAVRIYTQNTDCPLQSSQSGP